MHHHLNNASTFTSHLCALSQSTIRALTFGILAWERKLTSVCLFGPGCWRILLKWCWLHLSSTLRLPLQAVNVSKAHSRVGITATGRSIEARFAILIFKNLLLQMAESCSVALKVMVSFIINATFASEKAPKRQDILFIVHHYCLVLELCNWGNLVEDLLYYWSVKCYSVMVLCF